MSEEPHMNTETAIRQNVNPMTTTELRDLPGAPFPVLSAEMIGRMMRYGREDHFEAGQYLYTVGDREVDLFVILEGSVDVLENSGNSTKSLVATHGVHQFSGELDHLSGRAVLLSAKATAPTSVLRIPRSDFRKMIEAEPEIGEIMLRAFILRRARLIEYAEGGTIVVGSCRSGDTVRIQTFLERNGYPYRCLETDDDEDARIALELFHVNATVAPVVILNGSKLMTSPSNRELADCLGINERLVPGSLHDVVVVGAGPAGLAASVYAASEGLDTVVIDALGPGGQAGTSSRIENYLGFPMGISGHDLARRAEIQAQKFGARFLVARTATRLDCTRAPFSIHLDSGEVVMARSVVVATGARYRRLNLDELETFEGKGVHYAATSIEAHLCSNSEVAVVGGGNSAGQAAVFLSGIARHVHLLVRGDGLVDTMSDYLVERINQSSRITLHTRTSITSLHGDEYLTSLRWRERDGSETEHPISNLFLMIGAAPNTEWLNGCVDLDNDGFITTGHLHNGQPDGSQYATSVPGIFAVGDIRARSVKRVASSVGEGSVVVHSVHGWLASTRSILAEETPISAARV